MSLRLYMNHHVRAEVTTGLRHRAVDVLTAYDDKRQRTDDSTLLDRATELNRILFSQDSDLLRHAVQRQRTGERFTGVIYAHQLGITIGECIRDPELICAVCDPQELENRIVYLPLQPTM